MKRIISLIFVICLMFDICIGWAVPSEDASIQFTEPTATVGVGATVKLSYEKIGLENAGKPTKTSWKSSDTKIATVNSGSVKGVSEGEAVISLTLTYKGGVTYSAECTVTVFRVVTKISFSEKKLVLTEGTTLAADVTVSPENATNRNVVWSSSDTSVATVDENGVITGIAPGKCSIVALAADGSGKKAEIPVYIEPKVPMEATEILKRGYAGYWHEFRITFKNLCQSRKITYYSFKIEFTANGKTYTASYYNDKPELLATRSKQAGWYNVGYIFTYARNIKVYLTSVSYADGTTDYFVTDNLVGMFS